MAILALRWLLTLMLASLTAAAPVAIRDDEPCGKIHPRVFIINMFGPEASVFFGIPEFNLYEQNLTFPGLSPSYPTAHCTANGHICQLTTGEGEINAAVTITSLTHSDLFDLKKTHFLIAGIAGVNPEIATIGSAMFARYEVQVALQYEIDIRELGENFSTPYIPYGTKAPGQYPTNVYGTEVFEVNNDLRMKAIALASKNPFNETAELIAYREKYTDYAAARTAPTAVACDGATSDVYYSGNILSSGFYNFSALLTNGSAVYCATAQEDTSTLEALLRSTKANLTDFSRIIVMRTGADFDRPAPDESAYEHLFYAQSGGFLPSLQNLNIAGVPIIMDIVKKWDTVYEKGIKATNYIGDIFGTLGGIPDFGPYPYFGVA